MVTGAHGVMPTPDVASPPRLPQELKPLGRQVTGGRVRKKLLKKNTWKGWVAGSPPPGVLESDVPTYAARTCSGKPIGGGHNEVVEFVVSPDSMSISRQRLLD